MNINRTHDEIEELLSDGVVLNDIFVNHDCDEWGESGACTREQVEDLLDDWSSGMDFSHGEPDVDAVEYEERREEWREEALDKLFDAQSWMDKYPREDEDDDDDDE